MERHGQGGSAEVNGARSYLNGFIIVDPREASVPDLVPPATAAAPAT